MKKKLIYLILSAVMLLSLTGCQCKHEWAEANCVNAAVCSKCGEVQGEALGHNWAAADCETPETCARCGETQGEALGHNFDQWSVGEIDMSRSCTVCGAEERSPIDPKVVLASYITGNWNHTFALRQGYQVTCYDFAHNVIPGYMHFSEDGSGLLTYSLSDGDVAVIKDIEFEWALAEYYEDDNAYEVSIAGNGLSTAALLQFNDNGAPQLDVPIEDSFIGFTKNPDVEEFLVGPWSYMDNEGNLLSFILHEDGSLSGDMDGEISGKWYPKPVKTDSWSCAAGVSIRYEQNGEDIVCNGEIYICGPDQDYKAFMVSNRDYCTMSLYNANGQVGHFERISLEQRALQKQISENPSPLVVGSWISEGTFTKSEFIKDNSYKINFKDDGSFTALLDKELSGTWKFDYVSDGSNSINVSYSMSADGYDAIDAFLIIDVGSEFATLNISTSSNGANTNYIFIVRLIK